MGGKDGIESVLPLLPKIDVALVGEPTGMQPAIAEKGLMVLDVTAKGKSGHAARDEGENAIYRAIEDIEWFRNYKWEKEIAVSRYSCLSALPFRYGEPIFCATHPGFEK